MEYRIFFRRDQCSRDLYIVLLLLFTATALGQNSNLVSLNGGALSYTPFALEGQTIAVNIIPDFSYAGYRGGGVKIPVASVKTVLFPSGGNDTPIIQAAIDSVSMLPRDENGFRGAVLLSEGRYQVDQLFIEASGVVLRGEGQGIGGTILFAQLPFQHTVVTIQGTGSGFNRVGSSQTRITTPFVPLGARNFNVADASGYSVGDKITVTRTPNQFWIDDLGMDEETLCANDNDCVGWTTSSYRISHERSITAVSGNTITVDIPIVDVMEDKYGGGEIYLASVPGRIEQCGVENLRIQSYYAPDNLGDEEHAWIGVGLNRVTDSWVTNVTGQYLGFATVSIAKESNFNTIQECANINPVSLVTGGRRYSFNIDDGLGNLFQRNYTRSGRHDFVMGSRVTGPNVFVDNYSESTRSDIGPHQRWATGTLFDNVRGGQIRVQNRGDAGTGHGWAGNSTMFWNVLSNLADIKVESPKGGVNWGIGCTGLQQNGAGYWDNWNNPVLPRSLYFQQLQDRLGPQAVNNVTIPEQRTGNLYTMLEDWSGKCDFATPAANCPVASAVSWQNFAVGREGKTARLNWQVAGETGHDFYVIEWRVPGREFTPLATVREPVAANGDEMAYTYVHQQPAVGLNDYRIRQVGFDGTVFFSPIEQYVVTNFGEGSLFACFPNPANEVIQLCLLTNDLPAEVQLLNLTGSLLRTYIISQAEEEFTIPLYDLPAGVYLVRLGDQTQRIVKQ